MTEIDVAELRNIGGVCLSRATRVTANLLTRTYNAYLAPAGIEVTQFSILCAIARGEARSASDLAARVGVERSTLARNLDRLVRVGLIRAEAGEGRRVLHQLTEEGRARIVAALPLWRHAQEALEARVPADRLADLRRDLGALRQAARSVGAGQS